jgi:hypothetical protein
MAQTMKRLNCNSFQLFITFDEKDFYKSKYKKEMGCLDKTHKFFVSHHTSKSKNKDEHSHIEVTFDKKDSQLILILHIGELEDIPNTLVSDVPLEDCIQWFSAFFKKQDYFVACSAIFRFNDKFEPSIKLNYPLLTEGELLQDAKVCGYEIEFSNDSLRGRFIFSLNRNGTISALINAGTNITLNNFQYHSEIEQLSKYITPLLRNKENAS